MLISVIGTISTLKKLKISNNSQGIISTLDLCLTPATVMGYWRPRNVGRCWSYFGQQLVSGCSLQKQQEGSQSIPERKDLLNLLRQCEERTH